jgi:hypothetical protein
MSPTVKVALQYGTVDDGTYPAAGHGSCSATDESGQWPVAVTIQFACSGLIGIGSGKPFALSGEIQCP